ncbi:disintegrin and metalloproteinase domain-containing protein 18-like [Podargus strigoides]
MRPLTPVPRAGLEKAAAVSDARWNRRALRPVPAPPAAPWHRSPVLSQVVVPQQLPVNATGERVSRVSIPNSPSLLSHTPKDAVSYVLAIEGRPYTIHLQPHAFLSDDFRIYRSNEKGPWHPDSTLIKGGCHYRGYIEGFPRSAVTLSTCSGLRGFLQFENASYRIEPLGYSPLFEHSVYRVSEGDRTGPPLASSHPPPVPGELPAEEVVEQTHGGDETLSTAAQSPKYFEVYVVLDKALYIYLGSDTSAVTEKIIQVFSLVNSMFDPLNLTVVLSSLELWTEEDKIPTAGEAEDLLQRVRGGNQFPAVKIPDFSRKAQPGSPALSSLQYQRAVTLESFSVLLAQLLGRSLGMSYDDSRDCRCPGHVCVMSPRALHLSGAKAFSSCSLGDFETFLKRDGGACLSDSPRVSDPSPRRAAVCGNGVVEPGEQCDCGAAEACSKDKCCTKTCRFKPGVTCSSGLCCHRCQFKQQNTPCRPPADAQCDLAEFCSGTSASCPPDLHVWDGESCERGTGYCYGGRCRSPDRQCQQLYGKASQNAPVVCYEEINSQRDRFGHCGFHPREGYKPCAWRNLRCGKLICTYPYSTAVPADAAAVLYARVRGHLCVSSDELTAPENLDSLLVPAGTKCGAGKVCINNTCHPHSVLGYDCDSKVQCHGHGVCNNKRHCHCNPGWKPPDCQHRGSHLGGSIDSGLQVLDEDLSPRRVLKDATLAWPLLGFCLLLLLLLLLAIASSIIFRRRSRCCGQQPPSTEGQTPGHPEQHWLEEGLPALAWRLTVLADAITPLTDDVPSLADAITAELPPGPQQLSPVPPCPIPATAGCHSWR